MASSNMGNILLGLDNLNTRLTKALGKEVDFDDETGEIKDDYNPNTKEIEAVLKKIKIAFEKTFTGEKGLSSVDDVKEALGAFSKFNGQLKEAKKNKVSGIENLESYVDKALETLTDRKNALEKYDEKKDCDLEELKDIKKAEIEVLKGDIDSEIDKKNVLMESIREFRNILDEDDSIKEIKLNKKAKSSQESAIKDLKSTHERLKSLKDEIDNLEDGEEKDSKIEEFDNAWSMFEANVNSYNTKYETEMKFDKDKVGKDIDDKLDELKINPEYDKNIKKAKKEISDRINTI